MRTKDGRHVLGTSLYWVSKHLGVICACWPASVAAAGFFLEDGTIGWGKMGYVVFMSLWGSLAALLQRFAKGQDLDRVKIIIARDVINATLASFLTFLICDYLNVAPALAAVAFTLSGYGGARFMEFIYRRFVNKITKSVDDTPV